MEIMTLDINLTTVLVFLITLLLAYKILGRNRNLPPGPFALPLLGSVGILKRMANSPAQKVFAEAGILYGGIISVWIGPSLLVVVNGHDALNQFLVKQGSDFTDRPNWIPQFQYTLRQGRGVTFSNGDEWKIMRKFTLHSFRDFGVGKGTIEEKIIEECNVLIQIFQASKGTYKTIEHVLQFAVTNVICSIICGQRFDYDNETFIELVDTIGIVLKGQGFVSILNYIPVFMHPLFKKEYKIKIEREAAFARTEAIIKQLIKTHEDTYDENNIRDFIDSYINVSRGDTEYSKNKHFHKGNVFNLIYDLFQAGAETTSTALNWTLLYMIEYPDVQEKCRKVITDCVGDRTVRLTDRSNLPYIEAVIQEVLRLSNVVVMGVPRTNADRDVTINGYNIPKRTIILANLYSSNVDPKYWDDPEKFRPERFLDMNGKLVKKDSYVPLSAGPRNCIGEALARNEMFLMLCNFLQKIEFTRADDRVEHDFSTKPDNLITLLPNPYELKMRPL